MQIETTAIAGILLFTPKRFGDERGFFMETFRQDIFARQVPDTVFVQDNHSLSARRGTVRGLHFQSAPEAQGKLVRVTRGSVYDVAVDVRAGSPTYGRHVGVRLDAAEGRQLWIPPGFLHGFCTLEDNSEVQYKVTAYYSAAHDGSVLWNDPALGIDWPVTPEAAILSGKDAAAPLLRDCKGLR